MFKLNRVISLFQTSCKSFNSKRILFRKMENKTPQETTLEPEDELNSTVKKQKLEHPTTATNEQAEAAAATVATEPATAETDKIKKRKYALLIGYSGEGYFGLQRYL
jgi:hypothetical protein